MSLFLTDLKKLHEKGMALIWLRPKSKRPFEEKWTTNAPKEWAELENSFEKAYNVGVRLGEPSKLISGKYLGAIDCDVKATSRKAVTEMNEALRKLGLDLTSAPIVMSGRGNGSKHVYVQTTEPMRSMSFVKSEKLVKVLMPGENKNGKPHSKREMKGLTDQERADGWRIRPAWEISFMGTGSQTVLPPSIHPDTGMKYAWASPLTVKHMPTFKPDLFKKDKGTIGQSGDSVSIQGLDFKAEDVELYDSPLGIKHVQMIVEGAGCEDRSASLFTVTMAMIRAKFTDNQILSVLSDPNNWISGAAYEHTQSRDRGRAVKWLYKYTLLKARYNTDPMRFFDDDRRPKSMVPLQPAQAEKVNKKLDAEKAQHFPDLDGQGKPKPTLRNIVHALEEFLGGGLVAFNEFSGRPSFVKDTPYGGKKGAELADKDDLNLVYHLASNFRFEPSQDLCFKAHTLVAHRYGFHPVRDYLSSLTWDKTPRLDRWLEKSMNAEVPRGKLGREYLEAVSRKVLVAAVARIFDPGCKFDYVVVLEGNQGEGKSSALEKLASQKWFTDGIGDIGQKDVVDQMTGKWIIELGELASIRKSETELIKAFLSRQVDRVRMAYGRRSEDYPRQSIFIGSTNAQEYFTDETGNRRYWPVRVSEVDRAWVAKHRDQLWAEAVMRYNLGEDVYLTKELEAVAKREQEKRFEVDEWESDIRKIVAKDPGGSFVTTDLWRALNLTAAGAHPPMQDQKRIGKIMHRLSYIRKNKRVEGVMSKVWVKRDV